MYSGGPQKAEAVDGCSLSVVSTFMIAKPCMMAVKKIRSYMQSEENWKMVDAVVGSPAVNVATWKWTCFLQGQNIVYTSCNR